jgi:hypothetical protein
MGDSATKVYHHTMRVERLSYAPLDYDDVMTAAGDKPTRSPFSDDASAYWVEDSTPSDIGGTLVEFERMFANIPADRAEPNGLYPFEFPGNDTAQFETIGVSTGNYSETVTYSDPQLIVDIVFNMATADAAKLVSGETVQLINTTDIYAVDYGSGVGNLPSIYVSVTDVTGDTVTVRYATNANRSDVGFDKNPNSSFTTHTVKRLGFTSRDPLQSSSTSIIAVTYEKSSTASQLSSFALKFGVRNSSGNLVPNLSSSTVPSSAIYNDFIQEGIYINAEDENFERWKGNIYERKIILVAAK